MIFGGISLAGPGLVIAGIGLLGFVLTEPGGPPVGQIMMGTGGAMLIGGGVLAGFGFKRNVAYDKWVKASGIRPPKSGHALLVGGSIAAAAGISLIAWQADVVRRTPAGEVCNGLEGCTTPRADAALGIGVGILALGGAGTLLGIGIKKKLKYDAWMRAPVQPSITLLPRGAGLSLSGRF
jgi:hypothetical protein